MQNREFLENIFTSGIAQKVQDAIYDHVHETGRYPEIRNPYTLEVKELCEISKRPAGFTVQVPGNESLEEVQFIPCKPSDPVSLHWIIAVLQLVA